MIKDRYLLLGSSLTVIGCVIVVLSTETSKSVIYGAMGMAVAIVGLTAVSLPRLEAKDDVTLTLLKGSIYGMEPLLDAIAARLNSKPHDPGGVGRGLVDPEEEGQRRKPPAVYLPPVLHKSGSSVYIPFDRGASPTFEEMKRSPTYLLPLERRQGGVRVFTAGSYLGRSSPMGEEGTPMEAILNQVIVKSAGLCTSLRALEVDGSVVVEMRDFKIGIEPRSYRVLLGRLPTSLAASVVAAARDAPVKIANEEASASRIVARLTVLKGADS
jgi:hypothetical protein